MWRMGDRRDAAAVFVRLLGRPEVRWTGGSDDLLSGMPHRLLAYLAARGEAVPRDEVAALLWPMQDVDRRRGNLRRLLGRARALPYAHGLDADRERVWWSVASDLALIAAGDGTPADRSALLRGTLLDGLDLDEDDAFVDWLREERARLHALRRRLSVQHARERLAAGDAAGAAATAERLLDDDPLDEEALQLYLQSATGTGVAPQARALYRRFVEQLERELGLAPLETTRALAAALDAGVAERPPSDAHTIRGAERPSIDGAPVTGLEPGADVGAVPPLPLELHGGLVGRSRTLDQVRRADAPLLVLTGEPGVGKTATLRAAVEGLSVVWLRGGPSARGRPFAAVSEALQSSLEADGDELLERLDAQDRAAITQLAPDLVVAGGAAPRRIVDPAEGRGRLVAHAARVLRRIAGDDGVVLVDDLHDLDAASAEVVATLATGRARSAGPRLLASARDAELADAPGRGTLTRLEGDGLMQRQALEPWSESELHALIRHLSGADGGVLFARRLHAATGGNALFVMETLRHLFTVGLLRVEAGGGWSTPFDDATEDYAELPLPPTVRDAVAERVARLDAGTRRLLEAASLAEPPFTLEQVAPATALSEWLALEALERAVGAGLLSAASGGYRFGHEVLRRAVADGLSAERRALIERRLAWALERTRGSPSLIAAHFERAGRRGDAFRWHRRAAEEAAALYVPGIAVEHLERAAELAEHDRDRAEVGLALAGLLDRTVDTRARVAVLERAREAAERVGDDALRARVAIARVGLALDTGEVDTARSVGEDARPLAERAGLTGELHLALARAHLKRGDATAARAELDAGIAVVPAGPNELRGRYHLEGYVNCAHLHGDLAAAFEHVESALAAFEAIGHRELLAEALNFQGIFLAFAGRHDEGVARLEEGLAIAREVGHVAVQRRALLNLVKLHTDVADAAAAAPLVEEGLALAHDFEQRTTEVAFLLSDGYVRYLRGDLSGAARAYERARHVADADENPTWQVHVRLVAATPRILAGDVEGAAALLDEAAATVDARGLEHLRAKLDARRAALALAHGEPHAALAIVAPWRERDDVLPEERGEHACVRAAAYSALGDHAAALREAEGCADAPTLEVVLMGAALALEASVAAGGDVERWQAVVEARIDDGRAPPFEAVAMLRALAAARAAAGDEASGAALRDQAEQRHARLLAAADAVAVERYPETHTL